MFMIVFMSRVKKKSRYFLFVLLGWAIGLLVIWFVLRSVSSLYLTERLETTLTQHLTDSIDQSQFSDDKERRLNDVGKISFFGEQANENIEGIIESQWYSPLKSCHVYLTAIDGISISTLSNANSKYRTVTFLANRLERSAEFGFSCRYDQRPFWVLASVISLLFLLIHCLIPRPISANDRQWLNYLVSMDYRDDESYEVLVDIELPLLTNVRGQCFELLHSHYELSIALCFACDPRLDLLDEQQMAWFFSSLEASMDIERSLAVAYCPNVVQIDIPSSKLTIHGVEVSLAKTPFFYYAWYARQRIQTEGWIINPPANRPDLEQGKSLANFMCENGGHARAMIDLEEHGLKAKTLDQNRSKIKEELIAVLGKQLSTAYLFESNKDEMTARTRYRLSTPASQIRLKLS